MTTDGATSPDDPDWVEEVLSRAMERAEGDPETAAPVLGTPAAENSERMAATEPVIPAETASQADTADGEAMASPSDRTSSSDTRTETGDVHGDRVPVGAVAGGTAGGATAAVTSGVTEKAQSETRMASAQQDSAEEPGAFSAEDSSQRMRSFLEWGAVVLGALAVALLIKTFLMQAYFIPSTSMVPTLNTGDRILVNKVSYKLHDINRGDLVVFNRPPALQTGEDDLIKRVIALPGETIQIEDNQILIDGLLLTEPYLPDGMVTTTRFSNTDNCADSGPTWCQLRDNVIWVMGDNRTSSSDSRTFGPIDADLVVGRAFLRVWPLSEIGAL